MRVVACVTFLLLFGVMGANAAISNPLSQVAGVPVSVYNTPREFNQVLGRYEYPGYPQSFAMYETTPQGSRIHLSPAVSSTLTRMVNGWNPRRNKLAAWSIFALAREMGHVAIGDPMHGQVGHDDPGATAWAIKNYRRLAKQLGVKQNIATMRRDAVRILRRWERGHAPSF